MATGLSILLFFLLLFLLSLGIWVAPALITLGYILLEFFTPAPVGSLLASTLWDASWNWALTAYHYSFGWVKYYLEHAFLQKCLKDLHLCYQICLGV